MPKIVGKYIKLLGTNIYKNLSTFAFLWKLKLKNAMLLFASKKMKCLSINLRKHIQDLYGEGYNMLMKESK